MEARNRIFHLLKPPCTQLNGVVLAYQAGKSSSNDVIKYLQGLLACLQGFADSSLLEHLDSKLAEYIFFPISNIFRGRQLPSKAVETALQCLHFLLETGWKASLDGSLAVQLIILLTFLAGGDPTKKDSNEVKLSENAQRYALMCLSATFRSVSTTADARAELAKDERTPALGHTVTVVLDKTRGETSRELNLAALDSMESFLACVGGSGMLVNFFPGIVSSLGRLLTPRSNTKQSYQVLAQALRLLGMTLETAISDRVYTRTNGRRQSDPSDPPLEPSQRNESWLSATADQVKLILANVVKLREHKRREVRDALSLLCLIVVRECSNTLQGCGSIMLETLVMLSDEDTSQMEGGNLQRMLALSDTNSNRLRTMLHSSLRGLPRVMGSKDESAKQKTLGTVIRTLKLLNSTKEDMSFIGNDLLASLRDSLLASFQLSNMPSIAHNSSGIVLADNTGLAFRSVFDNNDVSGGSPLGLLEQLVIHTAGSQVSLHLAREALDLAQDERSERRIANLWIGLRVLQSRSRLMPTRDGGKYTEEHGIELELREQIYALALEGILQVDEGTKEDDRFLALAIETIAFRAGTLRQDFRMELVDALYPMLHCMGSSSPLVRHHAMVCTNLIASSCGYKSAQDLLVSNADYLINAIGMKLNTFDISPQGPQVLRMLIKLCGGSILPYMDDLTDGIFDALECFHGYPKLVQLLFLVLGDVVTEGVKASGSRTLSSSNSLVGQDPVTQPLALKGLVQSLKDAAQQSKARLQAVKDGHRAHELPESTPHRPWKDLKEGPTRAHAEAEDDKVHEERAEEKEAKLSAVHVMLKRITELTQHHLPSSDPAIRVSLLRLLSKSLPYLASHEDTFLPLLHTLWPVLVPRLADSEAYVICGVLDVMGVMCELSGQFMKGRIEAVWPQISRLWQRARSDLQGKTRDQRTIGMISHVGSNSIRLSTTTPVSHRAVDQDHKTSLRLASTEPQSTSEGSHDTATVKVYESTTARMTRRALRRFAQKTISSVRLENVMHVDLVAALYAESTVEGNKEENEFFDQDKDVMWLLAHYASGPYQVLKSSSSMLNYNVAHKPIDIEGAPQFAEYIF
ncbi:MAG: hypothetical protein M1828_006797 [Chrysothrix sp. TS-e1954]|nr:MAG: hypothetical protein M1828_006797 [Chrysothrix sp. TS-e1954]